MAEVKRSDDDAVIVEIFQDLKESGSMLFCDFVDYALKNKPDWFRVLTNNYAVSYAVVQWMESKYRQENPSDLD